VVLNFGMVDSGLFPASQAEGEGLNPDTVSKILNDMTGLCMIKTGTYTGDGSLSLAITGVGFRPKFVLIWRNNLVSGSNNFVCFKSDYDGGNSTIIFRQAWTNWKTQDGGVLSLDTDGFSVSDNASDSDPNVNTVTYGYVCFGWRTST